MVDRYGPLIIRKNSLEKRESRPSTPMSNGNSRCIRKKFQSAPSFKFIRLELEANIKISKFFRILAG